MKKWFIEPHMPSSFALALSSEGPLYAEQTPYQSIAIYETEQFGRLMVLDDCMMVTDRDHFLYHEMMSHAPLFTHPNPKNVTIIGGGDCGTLSEVLKHPGVERAFQVDIDERVTRLSERFFPQLCEKNNDPRAHLLFCDGLQWMAEVEAGSQDVIIVDSTDPVGPGESLFTQDFYQHCYRALAPQGILMVQSESPLIHLPLIQSLHQRMRAVGFDSTGLVQFFQPIYPTGWWSGSMAGKGIDVRHPQLERAAARPFATRYYTPEIHRASMVLPPFVAEALNTASLTDPAHAL